MKTLLSALLCLPVLLTFSAPIQIDPVSVSADLPELPFLAEESAPAPLAQINLPDGTLLGSLSGGWTEEYLFLKIRVHDDHHIPAPEASRLWLSDSIEIGIDARGNGSGSLPPSTTGAVGPDDMKLIFGLLDSGPAGWSLTSTEKIPTEELTPCAQIHREQGETIYQLQLPWTLFGTSGGAHPELGFDFQINNRDSEDESKASYNWGKAIAGTFRAADFPRLRLGPPAEPLVVADWVRTTAFQPADQNLLAVGVFGKDIKLSILADEQQLGNTVLQSAPDGRHYIIKIPAQSHGSRLTARTPESTLAEADQINAVGLYRELDQKLSALMQAPDLHPMFGKHLRSVAAQVHTQWARTLLQLSGSDLRPAYATVGYFEEILAGLSADAGQWEAYLDGRRTLLMSYVSPQDQSVQYYWFCLPRDWDPDKEYPLFFSLHGSGNPHPLSGLASRLGAEPRAQDLHGYSAPKVYAEIDRSGYWVQPFGRGNLGYIGIAQDDVLEAYNHVHKLVNIDPDRRYLYGFSMGGGGTWWVGQHTPGRWAAACSFSPSIRRAPNLNYLVPNWKLTPYKLLIGEEDYLLPDYQRILAELNAAGVSPAETGTIPGMAHDYRMNLQEEVIEWLKRHTRQRPDHFTYTTDSMRTPRDQRSIDPNTCWGVQLFVDHANARFARADVTIDGNTVTLETTGARLVNLDFSEPDGLRLTGDVHVILNGTEAYTGPAKPLRLTPDS